MIFIIRRCDEEEKVCKSIGQNTFKKLCGKVLKPPKYVEQIISSIKPPIGCPILPVILKSTLFLKTI
jgi:hypothetical protein